MNYKELHPLAIYKWVCETSEKEVALVMNISKEAAIEINKCLNDKGRGYVDPYRFLHFSEKEKQDAIENFHKRLVEINLSVSKLEELD